MKKFIFILALSLFLGGSVTARAITIDFEGLSDLEQVTNQFAGLGVTFTNAIVLTAGISLNEFDFPPNSGENVVTDDGGPMTLTFSVPFTDVGGFFTYNTQITLFAFDPMGVLVGMVSSAFSENFVSSGNPPNEFLQISGVGPIGSLQIVGASGGDSFTLTLDDFSATRTSVPEPSSLVLLSIGVMGILGYGLKKRRNKVDVATEFTEKKSFN